MRLLHAASSYPLTEADPTAPFMGEMLAALADRGNRVEIAVPRTEGLVEGARRGVEVVGVPYAPRRLQIWGYGRSLDETGRVTASAVMITPVAMAAMAREIRRRLQTRHDVLHLHWVVPLGLASLVVPDDVPVVISAHGADAKLMDGKLRWLVRRALQRADAVVAASGQILESVAAVHPDARQKSFVIPHGAQGSLFTSVDKSLARRRLGLPTAGTIVVGIGRLVPKKGFAFLIDAFSRLRIQNSVLVIVGAGPERSRLVRAASAHPEADIRLVGAAERPAVAEWLAASDVVAIPSVEYHGDIDSGPVVLMEAMAAGRPVVATSVGMAPDVVDNGVNGYLVDSPDPDRFAALLELASQKSKVLGQGAARTFAAIGDWSRVAEDLERVYRTAISRRDTAQLT